MNARYFQLLAASWIAVLALFAGGVKALSADTHMKVSDHTAYMPMMVAQPTPTPEPTPKPKPKPKPEQACRVSGGYPETVTRWCALITKHAEANGLDPNLVAALIWVESNGNPDAYSKSGAVGLMQVMPRDGLAAGFYCPNGPCFADRPSIAELQDPEYNLAWGTRFLAGLINRHGLRDGLRRYGPMNYGYRYADLVLSRVR